MNYLIVLFKNKEKRKIINKFKTFERAKKFYDELINKSDNVYFEKQTENGKQCFFEIALMEKKDIKNQNVYIKDTMGRTIRVMTDDDELSINKISYYRIEEEFINYKTKKKYTIVDFESKFLKKDGLKLISKINNKVVLQKDDDVDLFTFKSDSDCERFMDVLFDKLYKSKRGDCLLVKDSSKPQKKYLYNLLVEKGFSKDYLQRSSTTHLSEK